MKQINLFKVVVGFLILSFVFFICLCISKYAQADIYTNQDTTIIFTDDIHAYLDYEVKDAPNINHVGYAKAAALKKEAIANGQNAYLVDAGDNIKATSYSCFDKGQAILDIMKEAGYDFCVPGNHDWDFGYKYFIDDVANSKHSPYYCCNCYYTKDKSSVLDPYKIVETTNGKKIAFIGIMTPQTMLETPSSYFMDENGNIVVKTYGQEESDGKSAEQVLYDKVQETINDVKNNKGVDYVIGVGHIGIKVDFPEKNFNPGISSRNMIKNTHGFDAFIDGHSHTILNEHINDLDGKSVLLVQAGGWEGKINYDPQTGKCEKTGMHIGKMTITENNDGAIFNAEILDGQGLMFDEEVLSRETDLVNFIDNKIALPVINNKIKFEGLDKQNNWGLKHECNMGNLSADALYWYANNFTDIDNNTWNCDAAIMCANESKNLTSNDIGKVNTNDCLNVFLPWGRSNNVNISQITGQQILDVLEHGAKNYNENTNAGLVYVAGLKYSIDTNIAYNAIEDEKGNWLCPPKEYRVHSVCVYNKNTGSYENIDLNKTYNVAGSDYLMKYFAFGNFMLKSSSNSSFDDICANALSLYLQNFSKKNNIENLTSKNSPLFDNNYLINYENIYGGAGTITVESKPSPYVPPNNPQNDNNIKNFPTESANTGDNIVCIFLLAIFVIMSFVFLKIKNTFDTD